jgi:hypothetical protein
MTSILVEYRPFESQVVSVMIRAGTEEKRWHYGISVWILGHASFYQQSLMIMNELWQERVANDLFVPK